MIFIYLLSAAGITFALQHKLPFLHGKLSILDSMLVCTYCTGFHAGWITYLLYSAPDIDIRQVLLFSFASAIFSYALDEIVKHLEEVSYGNDTE